MAIEVLLQNFDVTDLISFGFDEKEVTMADIVFDEPDYSENEEGKKQLKVTCLQKDVPFVLKRIKGALENIAGVRIYA